MNPTPPRILNKQQFTLGIALLLVFVTVFAATFTTLTQTDFDQGTYDQTFYNTSISAVQLNATLTIGNYTSEVFNGNSVASWDNISWTQGGLYRQELPSEQQTETGIAGVDMAGNVLLLHLNETSGTLVDYSGSNNNGTNQGASYNTQGKFNTALSFDGTDNKVTVTDATSLNLTSAVTIETWMNIQGDSNTDIGTINTTVLDTLEYDTSKGEEPSILHIHDTTYAVAYRGNNDDGFIKTVTITADGTLSSVIDTLEFDTSDGRTPSMVHVAGNITAIAYRGSDNDGFVTTIDIAADGTIGQALDSLEFDTSAGEQPNLIQVSKTTYAVVYRGSSDDGFIKTMSIYANGTVSSVIDTFEYDTSNGEEPSIAHVSGTVYVIAYRGNNDDGFVKTMNLYANGTISSTIDTLEYDTSQGEDPAIIFVAPTVYAITYAGSSDDGFVTTVNVSNDGQIGSSVIDTFEYDTSDGRESSIVPVARNVYAVTHRGSSSDGFVHTLHIANDGVITQSIIDSLEFDTSEGRHSDFTHVSGDIYAVAYRGNNDDGFIKTIDITTHKGLYKADAYALDANQTTAFASILTNDTLTTNIDTGWNHFVFTYDQTVQNLYVNGQLQTSKALTTAIPTSTYDLRIGEYINGTIDEVALYNRAITAQEVIDHYKRGVLTLNLSVRSCTQSGCSDQTTWNDTFTNSPATLSVTNNTYFQYQSYFETENANFTPELYNVTIESTDLNQAPHVPTLNTPTNNSNITTTSVLLNTTVTDPEGNNLTVYFVGDGTTIDTQTNVLNGTSVTYNWTSLTDGTHNWSVTVGDNSVNTSSVNLFFTVNTTVPNTKPTVTPEAPINNLNITTTAAVLNTTAFDIDLNSLTVWIYGDDIIIDTQTSVLNGTSVTYNWTGLDAGVHTWFMIANDGIKNSTTNYSVFTVNEQTNPATGSSGSSGSSGTSSPSSSSGLGALQSSGQEAVSQTPDSFSQPSPRTTSPTTSTPTTASSQGQSVANPASSSSPLTGAAVVQGQGAPITLKEFAKNLLFLFIFLIIGLGTYFTYEKQRKQQQTLNLSQVSHTLKNIFTKTPHTREQAITTMLGQDLKQRTPVKHRPKKKVLHKQRKQQPNVFTSKELRKLFPGTIGKAPIKQLKHTVTLRSRVHTARQPIKEQAPQEQPVPNFTSFRKKTHVAQKQPQEQPTLKPFRMKEPAKKPVRDFATKQIIKRNQTRSSMLQQIKQTYGEEEP